MLIVPNLRICFLKSEMFCCFPSLSKVKESFCLSCRWMKNVLAIMIVNTLEVSNWYFSLEKELSYHQYQKQFFFVLFFSALLKLDKSTSGGGLSLSRPIGTPEALSQEKETTFPYSTIVWQLSQSLQWLQSKVSQLASPAELWIALPMWCAHLQYLWHYYFKNIGFEGPLYHIH